MTEKLDDILARFHHEAKEKFGIERIVTSRVGDLFVEEVGACASEIRDLEGSEKIVDVSRRKVINM